jgi:hypothetical protein
MKARLSKARMAAIRPGIWVDYRGAYFEVLHIGQDAQSPLDVVLYRAVGESAVMVMPRSEFAGIVEAFGERHWRFTALDEPNLFFDGERRAA